MHPSPNDVQAVFGPSKSSAKSDVELPVRELADLQIDPESCMQQQQHGAPLEMAAAIEGHISRRPKGKSSNQTDDVPLPPQRQQLHDDSVSDAKQFLFSDLAASAIVETVNLFAFVISNT